MFEYHGWFAIAESVDEDDRDSLGEVIAEVSGAVDQMVWTSGFAQVRPHNGRYFLYIGGNTNRPRNWHDQMSTLLSLICERARGSYGMLYWRDDEDESPPGKNNFHVFVMSKGKVVERFDPFLSPTNHEIEAL